MNIDYKLIGSRIKIERTKRGLTQEALAEKLDVSIGYVSQVERGITKISLDLLGAISAVLSCDVSELIRESAVDGANYMVDELSLEIKDLNSKQRAFAAEFIKLLREYD